MVFWITSHMKAKREQSKEEMMVIKLFASNYVRNLSCTTIIEHYHKMLYDILNIPHSYYVIYMNKQLVFGVIAVVFATALISSLVVDQASANRNKQLRYKATVDKASLKAVNKAKAHL